MATAAKVHLEASQQPQYFVKGITAESADKTNRLLQLNHEKHHIFFSQSGFHNHIVHHLLTLFALKASPDQIQRGYDINATYQRPPEPLKQEVVNDMHDPARFKTYLGDEKYYHDFLVFFQDEIAAKGWQDVLNEYLFKGDERADDMLVRMYGGFLHPLIHLGFGIEFEQPAVIAEALAQGAVHDAWMGKLFAPCERAAEKYRGAGKGSGKTIMELLEEARKDEKLRNAAHWDDGNKVRDGVIGRAAEEMVQLASQYTVDESRLEEQTAEMINAAVYFSACSQRPPHAVKFDFYYIHCLNSSIFFSSFLSLASLTSATKRRLLEFKIWTDIAMYTSRHCPALLLSEITNYTSKHDGEWEGIFGRVVQFEDDGHASKLIRALAYGEQVCKKFERKEGFMVKGDMWKKIGHMAIDSVEASEPHWVRSAGFDEAWESVPLREGARL
ncbi:hypothetical protein EK21DRAFT_94126 [Setomelanomma holmii]|uniref:HypA n=1 Tax=Setomelanomma holmii TaxID=210430 RepID=A0A9P4GZN0_9PLEO|nr:hypothetical protein EK21DRAFT_94126 [Setomelanomma holmii]